MRRILLLITLLYVCGSASASAPKVHVIDSKYMFIKDTVLVWSPSGMENEKRIPTVILLHGAGGNVRTWSKYTNLQSLSDKYGFRLVCFDGIKHSWYFNDADKTKPQVRDFFWKEFRPLIDSEYGLDPGTCFIAGLSMGGHGAMNIFLDNPDLFAGAASMSGVLDLPESPGGAENIKRVLGTSDIRNIVVLENSAVNRLDRLVQICGRQGAREKIISVSCGSDDRLITASEHFVRRCRDMGLKYFYFVGPGRHKGAFWRWSIDKNLELFRDFLDGSSFGIDPAREPKDRI